jgi:hypothetical protein
LISTKEKLMNIRRVTVCVTVLIVLIAYAVGSLRSGEREKEDDAIDVQKVVKETLASKKLPKAISVGDREAYYGKVRMFAVGKENTFTFWVYGSNPPPAYKAYTFSLADAAGNSMRDAVMYAIQHQVVVGVFADEAERPNWIVVYP